MEKIFLKSAQNPYQVAKQTNYSVFINSLSCTPTVEELNRTVTLGAEISQVCSNVQDGGDDRLFGTHIREAATTLKKLFHTR
jgi:hypothetical protein